MQQHVPRLYFTGLFIPALLILPLGLQCLTATFLGIFFFFRNHRTNSKQQAADFFRGFRFGGHRGSPMNAPENTIASFKQALSEGVDLVEFDVGLTKDDVPVLMHDDTLDRTTNMSGLVRAHTFSELASCNCAAKFKVQRRLHSTPSLSSAIEAAPICSIDEMVVWAKENGVKMIFDLKDADAVFIEKLDKLFEQHELYDRAIVCSFFPQVVYRIKRQNNKILTGITWRRWFVSYKDLNWTLPRYTFAPLHWSAVLLDVLFMWSVKSWLPHFLGVHMVLIERGEISENYVKRMREYGLEVCAWTVNDATEMAWMATKLQIPFLTDRPFVAQPIIANLDTATSDEAAFELN